MESTTVSGRDEQSGSKAADFAAELAKSAAKPKPAAKRKPAPRKPSGASRRARAEKAKPGPQQVLDRPEALDFGEQPVPLELASIGLNLADIVTGDRPERSVGYAETSGRSVDAQGLTLEEVSQLLVSRERRGFERGHEQGYQSARQAAMTRLQRERSEAVAGALLMVARQLEGVLHDLARSDEEGKAQGARHLAVLTAEFAKAADRFANGEDVPE